MVALWTPRMVGVNVTLKLVVPLTVTGVVGSAVTAKLLACAPLKAMGKVRLSGDVPILLIVNVLVSGVPTSKLPKSVSLVVEATESPSPMGLLLPPRAISGDMPVPWIAKL